MHHACRYPKWNKSDGGMTGDVLAYIASAVYIAENLQWELEWSVIAHHCEEDVKYKSTPPSRQIGYANAKMFAHSSTAAV